LVPIANVPDVLLTLPLVTFNNVPPDPAITVLVNAPDLVKLVTVVDLAKVNVAPPVFPSCKFGIVVPEATSNVPFAFIIKLELPPNVVPLPIVTLPFVERVPVRVIVPLKPVVVKVVQTEFTLTVIPTEFESKITGSKVVELGKVPLFVDDVELIVDQLSA
jgi:hypothetical protein